MGDRDVGRTVTSRQESVQQQFGAVEDNELERYGAIIESLRDHVELATNLGDHATAEILREILVQTEEDAHHVERYLESDTLVHEGSMN